MVRPDPIKRTAIVLVAVSTLAAVVLVTIGARWFFTSTAERLARSDVDSLSAAVAAYVADTGRLPRITVTLGVSGGGDSIWGADFQVESRTFPRADPASVRILFLVGDADNWCVEALYTPRSLFSDSSGAWVLAKGERGDRGKIVDGRCGASYVLALSPVTVTDVPPPATEIAAARASVGTCFGYPFSPDSAARPQRIDVIPCNSAHFGEVFFAGEGGGGDFGDFEEAAAGTCASELMPYVGTHRNISAFTAEPFTVDATAWAAGAREYTCFLYLSADDYPLVGSAHDSWR